MPKYINRHNVRQIVDSKNNPNEEVFLLFNRIRTIKETIKGKEVNVTQYSDAKKLKPIIETISLPTCDSKYTVFDETVEGDYFVNTPFKEMAQTDKDALDVELSLKVRQYPKTKNEIFNEVEAEIAPPVDETNKSPEDIATEKEARETLITPLMDLVDSKGASFLLALDRQDWEGARKRLSKLSQLSDEVVTAFEKAIPLT